METLKKCSGILVLTLLGAFSGIGGCGTRQGGHRTKAQPLPKQAIDEVKAGISFANEHSQQQSPNPQPRLRPSTENREFHSSRTQKFSY